jgi:prepilin-type processing-associated H-X9-DG protein
VVIAIISILSAILLPALSNAKKRAHRAVCISNLKQIGIALQNYIDDHEDYLPGPVWSTAKADYDKNASWELVYHLATYFSSPEPSGQNVLCKVFVCPGYERYAPGAYGGLSGRKIWFLNDDVDPNPLNRIRPFGYPDPESKPILYTSFDQNAPPSSVFALMDLDQYIPQLQALPPPGPPWWFDTPTQPVHGNVRNQLFFDWHVESVRW